MTEQVVCVVNEHAIHIGTLVQATNPWENSLGIAFPATMVMIGPTVNLLTHTVYGRLIARLASRKSCLLSPSDLPSTRNMKDRYTKIRGRLTQTYKVRNAQPLYSTLNLTLSTRFQIAGHQPKLQVYH